MRSTRLNMCMSILLNGTEVASVSRAVTFALHHPDTEIAVTSPVPLVDQISLALLKIRQPTTQIWIYRREYSRSLAESFISSLQIIEEPEAPIVNTHSILVSGCSFSAGYGVSENAKYSQILQDVLLQKPISNVALPGNGIPIILNSCRSAVNAQLLIVGLTHSARACVRSPRHRGERVNMVLPKTLLGTGVPLVDYLTSKQYYFRLHAMIEEFIDWADSSGKTLILADFLWQQRIAHPGYIDLTDQIIDYGDDHAPEYYFKGHPGPLTHQFYAEKIYQKLIELRPDLLD